VRVLVTGASGFSGANIAADFARRGYDVVATYRSGHGQGARLADMPNVAFLRADLRDPHATLSGPFDAVIHAAATSIWSDITVDSMVADNVEATRALIAACAVWRCPRLVFLSSVSIYGPPVDPEIDETTPIRNPDAYGMTKLLGEAMLAERADELAGMSLRLPAVVGPGAHRNWLTVSAGKIKRGDPVSAFDPEAKFNNAVHVADIAAFAARMIETGWRGHDAMILAAQGMTSVRAALERLAVGMERPLRWAAAAPSSTKTPYTVSCAHAMRRWNFAPMSIDALLDRFAREVG